MTYQKVLRWSVFVALILLGCSKMRRVSAGEADSASELEDGDRDATDEPDPEGSPCDTPLYTKNGFRTVDLTWITSLKACLRGEDDPLAVVRVDVEGSPICENLSRPPTDLDRSGEATPHECESDGDCPSGKACMCAVGVYAQPLIIIAGPREENRCVTAECTSASDCNGWSCSLSEEHGVADGFFCRSSIDDCSSGFDCERYENCIYYSGKWTCREPPVW